MCENLKDIKAHIIDGEYDKAIELIDEQLEKEGE